MWNTTRRFVVMVGISLLVLVQVVPLFGGEEPPRESNPIAVAPDNSSTVSKVDERPIEWSEIDAIYGLRSEKTKSQRKAEWKKYKGKKILWTGSVLSIDQSGRKLSLQVQMNPPSYVLGGSSKGDVGVLLKETEREEALKLSKGDVVMFTGSLVTWGVDSPFVSVGEGEIGVSSSEGPVSWAEIDVFYGFESRAPDLQKKNKWHNYEGREVRWTGIVVTTHEVREGPLLVVQMNPSRGTCISLEEGVSVLLKKTEFGKMVKLLKGDVVTFTGVLADWGTSILIAEGEIVLPPLQSTIPAAPSNPNPGEDKAKVADSSQEGVPVASGEAVKPELSLKQSAAIEHFKQALNYMSDTYPGGRDREKAEEQLKIAIDLDPEFGEPHLFLGDILADRMRYDLADAEIWKAIDLMEKKRSTILPGFTFNQALSVVYTALGDNEMIWGVQADLKQQAETHHQMQVGVEFASVAHWRQAMIAFRKAVELDPTNIDALRKIQRYKDLH